MWGEWERIIASRDHKIDCATGYWNSNEVSFPETAIQAFPFRLLQAKRQHRLSRKSAFKARQENQKVSSPILLALPRQRCRNRYKTRRCYIQVNTVNWFCILRRLNSQWSLSRCWFCPIEQQPITCVQRGHFGSLGWERMSSYSCTVPFNQ